MALLNTALEQQLNTELLRPYNREITEANGSEGKSRLSYAITGSERKEVTPFLTYGRDSGHQQQNKTHESRNKPPGTT